VTAVEYVQGQSRWLLNQCQNWLAHSPAPVIVIVVASVTVYVRVPYVKVVGDGHTVVYISVVRVVY